MRMPTFNHQSFAHGSGGNNLGTVSSFNISYGFVYLGKNNILHYLFIVVALSQYRKKRLNHLK